MWQFLSGIGSALKGIVGVATALSGWFKKVLRRREANRVEETTKEITQEVAKAKETGKVDEINKRFGF